MARPKKIIEWSDVEKLCAIQCTQEEIARFCECSVDTLERHCKEHFEMSFAEFFAQKRGSGAISLRRAQWQLAHKGNATMQIWLGKQYLDQKDKSAHELSGPNGRPIETVSRPEMTDEAIDAKIRELLTGPPNESG